MKELKKIESINLRKQGYSINSIASKLSVAKSSVSLWVRNVELTPSQISKLKASGYTNIAIEKRRNSRLLGEFNKRNEIIENAKQSITKISKKELWLIGTMLYWAEGGKTQRMVRFSNGDPEMIKIMMQFFRQVCKVPESKFRGYIHIHPHLDHLSAENHWSEITAIPISQFFKTYRKTNISSKGKKDTLPYGVLDVYVLDTNLFLKITGWAQGVFDNYSTKNIISDKNII